MNKLKTIAVLLSAAVFAAGCARADRESAEYVSKGEAGSGSGSSTEDAVEVATFAGGCFWCMEPAFEKLDGVIEVTAGYTGGGDRKPSYEEVSSGTTGYAEAIRVRYEPSRVSYEKLLDVFWRQIDPTDPGGQFADRGPQYRTAIFFHDDAQRRLAEESKAALERSGRFDRPIVTEVAPASEFFPAEEYHQDFYKKQPSRYERYRRGSGREGYIEKVWGDDGFRKPSADELRGLLTPMQYKVTQQAGTEPPFDNAYWDNKAEGIYVDVVSGEPLFSSLDKFDSGTGWPSFTRPLEPETVVEREDRKLFRVRTEVRSRDADSHLGHVFEDGPAPTGLRYCINSAALRFVPKEDLETEGYGEYLRLFEKSAER